VKFAVLTLSSVPLALLLSASLPAPASAAEYDLSHYGGDNLEGREARRFCWIAEKLDFSSSPQDKAQADRLTACIDKRLAAKATCVLKAVPSPSIKGCQAVVAFNAGQVVGPYERDGKVIGLTAACLNDPRYDSQAGTITPPDRVTVHGVTTRLSADCQEEEIVE